MVIAVAMAAAVVAATVIALVLVRRCTSAPAHAILSPEGYQEARVTIKGHYRPHTVQVAAGTPVRLRFRREEDDPCSERVVFSCFGVNRRLPAFQETTVEFVPTTPGTFLFTCQWGMYRGKLVVTAPRNRAKVGAGRAAADQSRANNSEES